MTQQSCNDESCSLYETSVNLLQDGHGLLVSSFILFELLQRVCLNQITNIVIYYICYLALNTFLPRASVNVLCWVDSCTFDSNDLLAAIVAIDCI